MKCHKALISNLISAYNLNICKLKRTFGIIIFIFKYTKLSLLLYMFILDNIQFFNISKIQSTKYSNRDINNVLILIQIDMYLRLIQISYVFIFSSNSIRNNDIQYFSSEKNPGYFHFKLNDFYKIMTV